MGLDSVELVMDVEKTFGIEIPDSEAEKIFTVGDLHEAVWRRVTKSSTQTCKSQALFYELRGYAIGKFSVSRKMFRPDNLMDEIIPYTNRRILYHHFAKDNNLKFPSLILSDTWNTILISVGCLLIGVSLLLAIFLYNFFSYRGSIFFLPVIGMLITWIFSQMLNPKRIYIEPKRVKDFTKMVLAMNYGSYASEMGVNRMEMESVINHLIAEKSGLDLEEIQPEKKFGDDLGLD